MKLEDATKSSRHYINNKDFLKALIDYKELCDVAKEAEVKKPTIPNYIAKCFLQIATRLSYRPNFINYTYKDDMISDGIENCLAYMHNFNPEKSQNPFAYFTQIIYYAFLRRIQKEKKQQYVKYKHFAINGGFDALASLQEQDVGKDFYQENTGIYNDYMAFIIDMDEKEAAKKAKAKKKKALEKFMDDDKKDK